MAVSVSIAQKMELASALMRTDAEIRDAALGGAAPVSTVIGEALGDSEDGAVLVAIDDELDIEVPCSTQVAEASYHP